MASPWMLVEDEPDLYEILSALLEMWGHDVVAFTNGEDALAWLEEVEQGQHVSLRPELLLSDIRLPGRTDGLQIARAVRASAVLGNIPVVLATAYHLSETQKIQILDETGADLLIYKPLPDAPRFHKLLDDVVAKRQQVR